MYDPTYDKWFWEAIFQAAGASMMATLMWLFIRKNKGKTNDKQG